MNISVDPELARFIEEQVRQGRFSSATEVIEAGLARLMLDPEPDVLDAEDIAAIREGIAQMNRGEGRPWKEVRAELKAKYRLP